MIDVEADYPPAFLDQSLRATLPHQSEADKPTGLTACISLSRTCTESSSTFSEDDQPSEITPGSILGSKTEAAS